MFFLNYHGIYFDIPESFIVDRNMLRTLGRFAADQAKRTILERIELQEFFGGPDEYSTKPLRIPMDERNKSFTRLYGNDPADMETHGKKVDWRKKPTVTGIHGTFNQIRNDYQSFLEGAKRLGGMPRYADIGKVIRYKERPFGKTPKGVSHAYLFHPDVFRMKSRRRTDVLEDFESGPRHRRDKVAKSGHYLDLKGGYKQLRRIAGLQTGQVDLRFTGKMLDDLEVVPTYGKPSGKSFTFSTFKADRDVGQDQVARNGRMGPRHEFKGKMVKDLTLNTNILLKVGFVTKESAQIARYHHMGVSPSRVRRYFALITDDEAAMIGSKVTRLITRGDQAGITAPPGGRFRSVKIGKGRGGVLYTV
jgi:hypothetical protein